MRPVLHGDAVAAARVLYALPEGERARAMRVMLARAEAADAFRKRFGRAHPRWGSGSLMSVAQRGDLPAEPALDDCDYARCLACVFTALADWRACKTAVTARK